ncbi:MAG: TraM recognition domain-containing protein, partial [Silvibacterium sp.]
MQSFHAALAGERGKSQAEVLLGCFSHKVLHALGDHGTAEWASNLLGKEVKIRYGTSTSGDDRSAGMEALGKSGMSFNTSEQVEPV